MEREYLVNTEGINRAASKHSMKAGELKHSTNTDFKSVGVLKKKKGKTLFWDTGVDGPVQQIKQIGSNIYAIVDGELHLKDTGKISGASVILDTEPQVVDDYLLVVDSTRAVKSITGANYNVGVNAKGAPVCDFLKLSKNIMYAFDKTLNRVYKSSPQLRIVAKVIGDHLAGAITINVTSTKYIRVGDVLEVYSPKASTMKYLLTVTAITSLTTFTVAALAMNGAVSMTTGSGLSDLLVTSTAYTGTTRKKYEVKVIVGGATSPNTFQWRVDGGAWSATTNMATTDVTLELGVKIKWGALTGHTVGNIWEFYETPGALTNQDELFYQNYHTTDQVMWNIDDNYGDFFLVTNPVGAADQMGTLLIVCETETHRYSSPSLDRICGYGTRSPKTIQTMGKTVLFANEKSVITIEGNGGYPVSNKVEPYLLGMDQANILNMCAGSEEESGIYRVFIGDTSEKSLTDAEIIIDTNNYKCDTASGREATCYGELVLNGSRDMYIGDSTGKIYKINTGTSDDGLEIAWHVETKDEEMGKPKNWKLWQYVAFNTLPGTIIDVSCLVDSGDPIPLGQISGQVTAFDLTRVPRGVTISFILDEVSADDFPGFEGYTIVAEDDGEVKQDARFGA